MVSKKHQERKRTRVPKSAMRAKVMSVRESAEIMGSGFRCTWFNLARKPISTTLIRSYRCDHRRHISTMMQQYAGSS